MMKFIIALVALIIANVSVFGQDALTKDLQKSFKRFELVKLDVRNFHQNAKSGQKISLTAYGRSFEFELTPHDLRAANYRAIESNANGDYEITPDEVKTYKGKLSDDPTSEVRFSVDEQDFEGMIYTGTTKFFVT